MYFLPLSSEHSRDVVVLPGSQRSPRGKGVVGGLLHFMQPLACRNGTGLYCYFLACTGVNHRHSLAACGRVRPSRGGSRLQNNHRRIYVDATLIHQAQPCIGFPLAKEATSLFHRFNFKLDCETMKVTCAMNSGVSLRWDWIIG